MIQRIAAFFRSFRIELTEFSGTSALTDEPVTIVGFVRDKTGYFLMGQLFKPGYRSRPVGTSLIWQVPRAARQLCPDATLLILEVGKENRKLPLFGTDYLRIPNWVRGEIQLPLDRTITRKKDYKEQVRKIRKAGFRVEIATSREQFALFYDEMYLPQVSISHGDSVSAYARESIVDEHDRLELLLIMLDDEAVAGELISYREEVPELHAVGVRNRDSDLIRRGALSACYHFGLQHLEERGFQRVSVGGSRSLLNDGVLQYKRKWGQRVTFPYDAYLLTRVLEATPATRNLLKKLPVICAAGDQLISLVFAEEAELNALVDDPGFITYHHYPGTAGLYGVILSDTVALQSNPLARPVGLKKLAAVQSPPGDSQAVN